MKQHNTLTLKQFIIRSVGVYFITLIIFCLFIFKVIPGCSLLQSKLVLFLLTILSFGLIYFEKEEPNKVKLNTMTSDKREAKPITSCDFSNNEL